MEKLDTHWLNSMYNNRLLVPEFPQHLVRWEQASVAARAAEVCELGLLYGTGQNESLDIFVASQKVAARQAEPGRAPVLVFLHGGYWRSLDKKDFSFMAPAFTQVGACVVIPNYALCPGEPGQPVTVADIVLQSVKALVWVYRNIAQYGGDPQRITVVGHSAGGHLAGMLAACVWRAVAADLPVKLVKNYLSLSGLFELETIAKTPYLQDSLKLTPAQVKKSSPAWLPAPKIEATKSGKSGEPGKSGTSARGQLYSVCGGDESAEFLRHNALIQKAWGNTAVPLAEPQPGLNHFSILEAMIQPGHRLNGLALELLGIRMIS
jgi:arylformamidase